MILDFQMNHLTTVEMIEPSLWRIAARSDDNLFSGEVLLDVKLPALDIRHARLNVKRDLLGLTPDLSSAEEKLVGVRVGPGMSKIVRGVVGGQEGSERMAELGPGSNGDAGKCAYRAGTEKSIECGRNTFRK